jgi:protein tyrosine/serine phosphatase
MAIAQGKTLARVAIPIAIIAVAALFWTTDARRDVLPKRLHEVVPDQIYRSGELTPAATRHIVQAHHIKTIVDLGAHEPGTPEDRLAQAVADELGVERIVFDLEGDATGDPNHYVSTLRLMTDPEHQPVLVHCGAGTERTGCAVILYRNIIEDVPIDVAYDEAVAAGHSPRRNPRLKAVLDRWAEPIADAFKNGRDVRVVPDAAKSRDEH